MVFNNPYVRILMPTALHGQGLWRVLKDSTDEFPK